MRAYQPRLYQTQASRDPKRVGHIGTERRTDGACRTGGSCQETGSQNRSPCKKSLPAGNLPGDRCDCGIPILMAVIKLKYLKVNRNDRQRAHLERHGQSMRNIVKRIQFTS
jgi:hypothetical protein